MIGREQEGHHRARRSRGGLDDVRRVVLVGRLIEELQLHARRVRMLGEVVVATVGHALEFVKAPGELEFDVRRALGIVREVLLGVLV